MLVRFGIAFTIPGCYDSDVVKHCELEAVLPAIECTKPSTVEERSAEVTEQARACGDVQEDNPCRTLEAFGEEFRIVPVHHPSVVCDCLIMQGDKLV